MHDDLIFEALVYHRNVGASLSELHEHLEWRQSAPQTKEDYLSALRRLEAAERILQVGGKWFLTPDSYKQAKGKALEPEWQWEDSWILLALLISSPERKLCKLEDIIHAADYINRALPSLGELHGALNRLSAGRLLRTRKGRYSATERAYALLEKVDASGSTVLWGMLGRLRRIMECPCCGVTLKSVRWRINLDEDMYAKALKANKERFAVA